MDSEKIFKTVLDCSFQLHGALGPGLHKSAYEECLYYELIQSGLNVKKHLPLPLVYKEVKLDATYRIDLLVNFNLKHLKDGIKRVIL